MKEWRTPYSFSANKYEIRFSDGWGFSWDLNEEEKKEVINEANKIYDVEEVIPSIYLASELSRTKTN